MHIELSGMHLRGSKTEIKEFKRPGKFDTLRSKPRTLLLTVTSEYDARLTITKSHQERNKPKDRKVYILPALSKEDAEQENDILKKRRKLLTQGVQQNSQQKNSRLGTLNCSTMGKKRCPISLTQFSDYDPKTSCSLTRGAWLM